MKTARAQSGRRISFAGVESWVRAVRLRLFTRDGSPSIDGLDAAIRGFGVAIVLLLSAFGPGSTVAGPTAYLVDPLPVAAGLVFYNLLVIVVLGVPWRHSPGFTLFVLDWAVASTAILITGGFLSPFIILYYALIIGAALRVGLARSLMLVACCGLMYTFLSVLHPQPDPSVRLPILVVQITSLAMVMFMSVGMKRVVEVEARKVEIEEESASRLRLLNNLTQTVLSASPDLDHVLRAVASASSEAVHANSGLAVLFESGYADDEPGDVAHVEDNLLIAATQDPNPQTLSSQERRLLETALHSREPVLIQHAEKSFDDIYPGLESNGKRVCAIACLPFTLSDRVIGALFVGRYNQQPFTSADVNLLTALSQQMAVAVRLARLYDLEREKAIQSEERERLERDLLSTVSHELRTPLTSIKTCVGALTETDGGVSSRSPIESRMLGNIGRSTDRLIGLVNELLDMSRLRAGRVTLNLQVLNLGEVVLDAATQVRPMTDEASQTLVLDLPAQGSERWQKLSALADRRRIEQVLLNLLSNANKYGSPGSKIVVGATPKDGSVKVFVRDEGPGIERFEQRLIFNKFYRGHPTGGNVANRESTGLGLAIARSIVELHHGHIGVYSKVGAGSTFFFTLPIDDGYHAEFTEAAGSALELRQ